MAFLLRKNTSLVLNNTLERQWNVLLLAKRLISVELKEKLAAERLRMRKEFELQELKWEDLVDLSLLGAEDMKLYEDHKAAVQRGHFTYDDPVAGKRVMTRLRHFHRGSCCGNACRHCIYNHENVEEGEKVKRIYNSAFWVLKESRPDLVKRLTSPEFLIIANKLDDNVNSMKFRTETQDGTDRETDPLLFRH